MKSAEELIQKLQEVDCNDCHYIQGAEALCLIQSRDKEIEDEAYKRGYANGYARQGHDEDWEKVEANL
jgi:hypothetical protein